MDSRRCIRCARVAEAVSAAFFQDSQGIVTCGECLEASRVKRVEALAKQEAAEAARVAGANPLMIQKRQLEVLEMIGHLMDTIAKDIALIRRRKI